MSHLSQFPVSHSPFANVPGGVADPILGLTEMFRADTDPRKVNLGVGVYQDRDGKSGILPVVARAARLILEREDTKSYISIEGLAGYNQEVQKLLFGVDSEVLQSKRAVTIQSVGGSGGLRLGADLLKRAVGKKKIFLSDPSWENHKSLFEAAGFETASYPYYDPEIHGLKFEAFKAAIEAIPERTVVLLHACCHNPTGVDLEPAQWDEIIPILLRRELIPFLDLAYQGFGAGLNEDVYGVRALAATGLPFVVVSSFSKSFSLYRERVGALTVVTVSAEEAERVLSQTKRVIRTIYSSPPAHGGFLVATVLSDQELRAEWESELATMRNRIQSMRHAFVEGLSTRIPNSDFSFINRQCGMFSYSGLPLEVVRRLRDEFHIYILDSGRVCVAALNERNLPYVCDSIAASMKLG